MSVWSLAFQPNVCKRCYPEKHLWDVYPQDGGESQMALKLRHCHPTYMLSAKQKRAVWSGWLFAVFGERTLSCSLASLVDISSALKHTYVNKTCLVAYPRKQRHDRWKVSQVLKSKMRYVRCSVHTCKTASRKRQTYGSKKSQEFMHYSCVN